MSNSVRIEKRLVKDRLSYDDLVPLRKAVAVVSPTVTRRPVLDAMLGDVAVIAHETLQTMRNRIQSGHQLDEDEIKDFKNIVELVLKQARLEMAVEKHVEERTATLENAEISSGVSAALVTVLVKFKLKAEIVDSITKAVLVELGLAE
jgi:hypothetical protein